MIDKNLLRGSLDTIILNLMQRHGELYGYEITQKVKQLSNGEIQITEGALYPSLHKMEANGILVSRLSKVDGRKRKYYALSSEGERIANNKLADFNTFLKIMSQILNPAMS